MARVTSIRKIKFQCFQILEEEGHNDSPVAGERMTRSAALWERQMRPSPRKRLKDAQRFNM